MNILRATRRHWWIIVPGIALLVILILAILAFLSKPSTGIVSNYASSKTTPHYDTVQFNGKLFSFSYSNSLQQKEYVPEQNGIYLEKVTFSTSEPLARHLTASVRTNNDVAYTEIPDIKKRRLEPTIYTEEPITIANRSGLLFSRTAGGFERTAFIPRADGSVAALSLTSAELGRQKELLTEWQQLTASFVLR